MKFTLNEKLFQVSLAFLVFGRSHKSFFWRRHVEKLVLRLVEATTLMKFEESLRILSALEMLLRLSEQLKYVDPGDAKTLFKEISILKLLIDGINDEEGDGNQVGIDSIFKVNGGDEAIAHNAVGQEAKVDDVLGQVTADVVQTAEGPVLSRTEGASSLVGGSLDELIKNARSRSLIANIDISSVNDSNGKKLIDSGGNQSNRQSAIVDLIRQSGNCRMKDIMASFPNTSERTLRNDLQKVCEQGLVRRVGNGGAYTFYTAKL